jgi:hypothetical protein
MTRSELEHVISAAGAAARDREIVVIGSQALLGEYPGAPSALLASVRADVFPNHHPERAGKIDHAVGEGSRFHEQFGYYAQAVSASTATLPKGWRKRLVHIDNENTRGVVGLCLEAHDLVISKYVAGREKDLAFTAALARRDMVDKTELLERLAMTSLTPALRKLIQGCIERDFRLV